MRRIAVLVVPLVAAMIAVATAPPAGAAGRGGSKVPPNVDVSRRVGNESEETIAVNPTDPQNIVTVANVAEGVSGMFEGVSFDGGQTWKTSIIADEPNSSIGLGDSCCDPSLSFDEYGNLFLTYLYESEGTLPIALSTDGGLTFDLIANISGVPKKAASLAAGTGERRALFRFIDQPTITAGEGEVWAVVNVGGPIGAFGASVTGLGQVGTFSGEVVPGTNNCTYGDVAI